MANSSYQNIREQFIALQVDLDDKNKICSVLEHKIQVERSLLSRIESDAATEYQAILESELQTNQFEMERLRESSNAVSEAIY